MVQEAPEEEPLKICRFCRFWTGDPKGFCNLYQQAVGQFFFCDRWQQRNRNAFRSGDRRLAEPAL